MRWLLYIAIVCIIVLLVIYLHINTYTQVEEFDTSVSPTYIKGLNADVVDLQFLNIVYDPSSALINGIPGLFSSTTALVNQVRNLWNTLGPTAKQDYASGYLINDSDRNTQYPNPMKSTIYDISNYGNLCWQRGMRLVKNNDELRTVLATADAAITSAVTGKSLVTMDGNIISPDRSTITKPDLPIGSQTDIVNPASVAGICVMDTPINKFTGLAVGNVIYIIKIAQIYTSNGQNWPVTPRDVHISQKNHGPITPNMYQFSITSFTPQFDSNGYFMFDRKKEYRPAVDDIYCGAPEPPIDPFQGGGRTYRENLANCYMVDQGARGTDNGQGGTAFPRYFHVESGYSSDVATRPPYTNGTNFARRFFYNTKFGYFRPATQQEMAYLKYRTNNNLASFIKDSENANNNNLEKNGSIYQFIVGPPNLTNSSFVVWQPAAGRNEADLMYGRKMEAYIVNKITIQSDLCTADIQQKCDTIFTQYTKNTGKSIRINTIDKDPVTQKYKTSDQLLDVFQRITDLVPEAEECFQKCIFFGSKTYNACSELECNAEKAALRNSLTAFNTFSIDKCKYCPPDSYNPSEILTCAITNTVMTCTTPSAIRLPPNEPYKIHVYSIVNPNDGTSGSYQIDLFSKYVDISNDATGVFVVQDTDGANQIIYNFQPGQITIKSSTNPALSSAWTSNIPIPIIYNKYPQVIHVNVYKKPLTGWAAGVIPPPVLKGEAPLGASTCVALLESNIITGTLQTGLALPYGSYHLIISSTSGVGAEEVVSSLYDKTVYFDASGANPPTFNSFTLDVNTSTFRLGTSPTKVTTKIINSPRDQILKFYLLNPAKTIQYFGEPSVQVPSSFINAVINRSSGEQGVDYQVDFKDSVDPLRIRKLRSNTPYIMSVLAGAPGSMPAAMTEVLRGNYNPGAATDISGFRYNRFNNSITIGMAIINGTPPRDTTTPRQFRFNVSIDDAIVQGFRSGGGGRSKRVPLKEPRGVEPFASSGRLTATLPQGVEPFALQTIFDSSGASTEPTESIFLFYANTNTIRGTFTVGTQTVALAVGKYAIQFAINGSTANIPRVDLFNSTPTNSTSTRLMRFEINMQTGALTAYSTETAVIGSPNATSIKFKRSAYTLSATLIETTTGTVILSSGNTGLAVYATHYDAMPPLGTDTNDELFLVKPAAGGGITSSQIGTISGAAPATLQQVREALYMGANWTEAGWIASEVGSSLPRRAVYPLSDEYVVQRYGLPNFANMAGDELAPLDKKKVVAYLPANGMAAGVLMYGKKTEFVNNNSAGYTVVEWNTYRRIAKKADTESNNEVYPVELLSSGSTIPVSGATEICQKFNASVALEADLQTAAERGADWCKPGWTQRTYRVGDVANLVTAAHPVNESSTINACSPDGRRKTAVIDGAAAQGSGARAQVVNCYGVKRAETANTVDGYAARPFNARTSAWSQNDAADYTTYYFRNQKAIAGETALFKRAKLMVDEARRTGALLRRAGSDSFKGCDINAEACFPRTSGVSAPTLREVVQPVSKTGKYMGVDLDDIIADGDSAIVKEEKAIRWIIDCQEKKGGAVQLGPGEEYPGCGDGLRCCAPESIYGLNAGMFGTDPDCPAAGVTEEDCVKDTKLPTATVPRLGLKNPGMIKPKCVESVGGSLQSIRTIANNLKANKLSALRMGSGLK